MNTKSMLSLWAAYALKCLKATNGNVQATIRAMNLNNKHRAKFVLQDNQIKFNGMTVITLAD